MATGTNPYEGTPRLEIPTELDGEPGLLVAYRSGDPGVYDEFAIDLVTEGGTFAVSTTGVGHESADVHVYAYEGTDDVSASSRWVPGTGEVNGEMQSAGENLHARRHVESSPALEWTLGDRARAPEDKEAFVEMLQDALVSCGHGAYDWLRDPDRRVRFERQGPLEVLALPYDGIGRACANVTGDSLTTLAGVAIAMVSGRGEQVADTYGTEIWHEQTQGTNRRL